jgi:pyridoxamine 5'-phosphate oxidase
MSIDNCRDEPESAGLTEVDLDPDPIRQFHKWFEGAALRDIPEPGAMVVATSTPDGRPSVRFVLLRGYDERGFVFFTSYESRKGRELAVNPQAALAFYWHDLDRQVRVEGRVERVSAQESDDYFDSRPSGSRLGAWASRQSEVISDREVLEARCRALELQYPDRRIPRPAHWGGYRVIPGTIEFWQGRPNRLHDRLRYTRREAGWVIDRLSP